MPSRRKLISRKLERRVVGQATLLALLQPAAKAGCVALELYVCTCEHVGTVTCRHTLSLRLW